MRRRESCERGFSARDSYVRRRFLPAPGIGRALPTGRFQRVALPRIRRHSGCTLCASTDMTGRVPSDFFVAEADLTRVDTPAPLAEQDARLVFPSETTTALSAGARGSQTPSRSVSPSPVRQRWLSPDACGVARLGLNPVHVVIAPPPVKSKQPAAVAAVAFAGIVMVWLVGVWLGNRSGDAATPVPSASATLRPASTGVARPSLEPIAREPARQPKRGRPR